jgi:hypothetical protein
MGFWGIELNYFFALRICKIFGMNIENFKNRMGDKGAVNFDPLFFRQVVNFIKGSITHLRGFKFPREKKHFD